MSISGNLLPFAFRAAKSFIVAITILALSGCFSGRQSRGGQVKIQGAGSTFINPIMQKWVHQFGGLEPNIRIDYQSIGSGGGIKQLKERTVQFGATDTPMSDADLASADAQILHVPVILGAVVITYNVPELKGQLKLSPETIAAIFLGKVTRWDDPMIQADNPGLSLPAENLTVVHRSDGSGTSAVFTNYLSKVSPEWRERVGEGTSPNWPIGLGGKGNEGVTGQIKQTPNTIGYVELAYAQKNSLPVAAIKNKAGNFVMPNTTTVTRAAALTIQSLPADLRAIITNADVEDAYPIASYSYILVYKKQENQAGGKALVEFLRWCINDGQREAQPLYYSPLPAEVARKALEKINSIEIAAQANNSNN